jgi:dTDP-4-amino-4,6-dideoxygalactose transaminase
MVGRRAAGTLGNVGGYSLNYHKHIHTGEGGIVVTDDDALAERLRLIRNHAEAVVGGKGENEIANMIGYNFRLGEVECAIGLAQLKKLRSKAASRTRAADRLTAGLAELEGLEVPVVREGCTHVYYVYPLVVDVGALGVTRAAIKAALEAEGLSGLMAGYQNLHLLPMYQRKIAYGSRGFPWTSDVCKRAVDYRKGICPVAEELHDESFLGLALCVFEFNDDEIDLVIAAFRKVWSCLDVLRGASGR